MGDLALNKILDYKDLINLKRTIPCSKGKEHKYDYYFEHPLDDDDYDVLICDKCQKWYCKCPLTFIPKCGECNKTYCPKCSGPKCFYNYSFVRKCKDCYNPKTDFYVLER